MHRPPLWLVMPWLAAAIAVPSWALEPGQRVDNFMLLDHNGVARELYYFSDAAAVVLVAHAGNCPTMDAGARRLAALRDRYDARNVQFFFLDSTAGADRRDIDRSVPVLLDDTQLIGESLGISHAGDAIIIQPERWRLAYRGAAGNGLADALDAVLAGADAPASGADATGCAIDFPQRARRDQHATISYADEVAPVLIDRCVACHRDGGIAPFAMTEYGIVRGFAPMIREVLRTKRMPPWHADPHYGTYDNDGSLSHQEMQTLVHWVEAGAPRGDGPDPLASLDMEWPEWTLGEPDLVVELPSFDVPATGVVDYQNVRIPNPLDEDVWVRAMEILPGDRAVVHHVIATAINPGAGARQRRDADSLGGFVPGTGPLIYPEDAGIFLSKDAEFGLQIHYTTYGKATTDVSRMGLYFMETPKYRFRSVVLSNPRIRIPPNTKWHADSAAYTFERDVLVHSLLAHAHYRGRAAEFRAIHPSGREEILLSVPNYDFNWQTTYELAEPRFLPAGTEVVYTSVWDNSTQNRANPDPDRTVPWGQQSWDEMLYGRIRFRYVDEIVRVDD